ncbi:MAG: alpha/beta hydrolase [Chloroflexota bacterium]|nr:alpha/beta hydrolase [Chloroflexota bacterium]
MSVGSCRVYCTARGQVEGTPVVFIHGAGGNRLLWGSQLRGLSSAQRVVALDLPGHGRSDGPGMATIGSYAEVAAEVLGRLGSAAVLVGHSMGGGVALQLALEWPGLVAGLVLLGTGGRLRVAPSLLGGLQDDFGGAVEAITGLAFATATASAIRKRGEGALLAAGPATLLGDFQACDSFDVLARLGEIHFPCLVICGAEDRLTPVKYSESLARGIPGARLQVIPSAGHMAMLEEPAAVSQSIFSFVSGL